MRRVGVFDGPVRARHMAEALDTLGPGGVPRMIGRRPTRDAGYAISPR